MSWTDTLVAEARSRHPKGMARRERTVMWASAAAFLAAAVAVAIWLPSERDVDPLLAAGLALGYAVASRVRFEVGSNYVVPEELLLVPMLLLVPLPAVPALVAAAALLAMVPDFARRTWHPGRWVGCLADSWFVIGPVLVLAAFAPGPPAVDHIPVYLLAFAAQLVVDFAWSSLRDWLADGLTPRDTWDAVLGCARFDALLAPLGFLVSLPAADHPLLLLGLAPLVMLLDILSRDRRERFAASIELQAPTAGP